MGGAFGTAVPFADGVSHSVERRTPSKSTRFSRRGSILKKREKLASSSLFIGRYGPDAYPRGVAQCPLREEEMRADPLGGMRLNGLSSIGRRQVRHRPSRIPRIGRGGVSSSYRQTWGPGFVEKSQFSSSQPFIIANSRPGFRRGYANCLVRNRSASAFGFLKKVGNLSE